MGRFRMRAIRATLPLPLAAALVLLGTAPAHTTAAYLTVSASGSDAGFSDVLVPCARPTPAGPRSTPPTL